MLKEPTPSIVGDLFAGLMLQIEGGEGARKGHHFRFLVVSFSLLPPAIPIPTAHCLAENLQLNEVRMYSQNMALLAARGYTMVSIPRNPDLCPERRYSHSSRRKLS